MLECVRGMATKNQTPKAEIRPRATVLNLVGKTGQQRLKLSNAHFAVCEAADLPYIKVTKEGRFYLVEFDMISATYQLSEDGKRKAESLREANDLMIWTRHPKYGAFYSIGRYINIECLSEEIALFTADALALVASLHFEPRD